MQPKTNKQFGWFSLLMIAVISGLIVRVVGDPLVEILSPKIADITKEAGDWFEDWFEERDWRENLQDWLDQILSLTEITESGTEVMQYPQERQADHEPPHPPVSLPG